MGDDGGLHYPKGIMFILLAEFGERFCFSGIRTIATLYLSERMNYSEEHISAIFHTFVCTLYFSPMLGAMIADSWIGKYRTIIWMTLMYIFGVLVLSSGTMKALNIFRQPAATYLGLMIIAVTAGSYKPCSSSFGGDQFVLPQQEVQLSRFFSMFYFAISVGTLLSIAITPELSERVECLKGDSCYALAFGMPGLFMLAALVIFISGTAFYTMVEPDSSIFLKFYGCIFHALLTKYRNKDVKKDHWLDFASDAYDQAWINDVKLVIKVMVVYLPLPLFWSLYEQQFTGWFYQARQMNGMIGDDDYVILPYQMQLTNPAAILVLIVLFDYIFYPLLRLLHIGSPLQKMCFGGILAGIAFLVSGAVSAKIEAIAPIEAPAPGYSQVRIYNTIGCDIKLTCKRLGIESDVKRTDFISKTNIRACGHEEVDFSYTSTGGCEDTAAFKFNLTGNKAIGVYFYTWKESIQVEDEIERHEQGMAKIRFFLEHAHLNHYWVFFTGLFHNQKLVLRAWNRTIFAVRPDTYKFEFARHTQDNIQLAAGGVYALLFAQKHELKYSNVVTLVTPEKISILWQLPQNILLAAGEVMMVITGMEFAYTQAPKSMKAIMEAIFWLTYAFGNLIVVVIASLHISHKHSSQFYFYGAMMILDMMIFACLAMRYEYVK